MPRHRRHARRPIGIAAAIALATVTLATTAAATPAGAASADRSVGAKSPAVTGFQGEWSPTSRIKASADALTTVGVDGVNIAPSGASVPAPSSDARRQLSATHRWHLRGEILVGNYDEDLGDFSEQAAYRLLSSEHNRAVVISQIVDAEQTQGWDGVCVDLEALRSRDRAGLTSFVAALDTALPVGATLSIAISTYDSAKGYARAGYDLPAIADAVDRVTLMAYDQHGPWEDTPGPVGALPWQRAGLEAMLESVPAAKVELGVAGYGYDWRPHSAVSVSDAKARKLVAQDHATATYDASAHEWTATLSDGSVLWWSDARSYQDRVPLVDEYGLEGLAVWSLGLSDPIEAPKG